MEKTAVDKTAKDFWISYLKDYGQMWVRDLPRRIKQAVKRELKASTIEGEVVPLAKDISKDNTLSVEAAFIGKVDDKDAKVLITASFNGEGKLEDLDITRIS
jgi:hypothetical protein